MISAPAVRRPGLGSFSASLPCCSALGPAPLPLPSLAPPTSRLLRPLWTAEPAAGEPGARLVVDALGEVERRSTFFLGKKPSLPVGY